MAKPKRLNDANSEVIENNILKENPEGFDPVEEPDPVVISREIPKMETIIFTNNRDPGLPLEFHYHSATHPLKHYKLLHGHQYTLPLEVVRHLEGDNPSCPQSCSEAQYGYRRGADGHPEMYVKSYKNNYMCKRVYH